MHLVRWTHANLWPLGLRRQPSLGALHQDAPASQPPDTPRHHCRRIYAPRHPAALAGLKVIELGQLIAGPFAAKTLADFGAEVIKPVGWGEPANPNVFVPLRFVGFTPLTPT
jgi:hypothetical protein